MANYMSRPDRDFLVLGRTVYSVLTINTALLKIPTGALTSLGDANDEFEDALNALDNPATDTPANREVKKERRKALDSVLRPIIQGYVYNNPAMAGRDHLIVEMTLPLHDKTPTTHPAPTSKVQMDAVPTGRREHTVTAIDAATKTSKKPADAYGVKFACRITEIGAPVPTDYDDFGRSVFSRKPTVKYEHDAKDVGKMAYYIARYENAKGQAGPWSPAEGVIIA